MFLYARLHSQEKNTPQEVKEEVLRHLKEKVLLEQSLPSIIVIGPFMVNVEFVRKSLSKKRRALANAVIDRLALKLHKQMEEASFTILQHTVYSQFYLGDLESWMFRSVRAGEQRRKKMKSCAFVGSGLKAKAC